MLDYVPTDLKYNPIIEEFLLKTLGHGIISKEAKKHYEELSETFIDWAIYEDVPGYINEEDIALWEAEKILYEASLSDRYPEAYNKEASKLYTMIKK